MAFSVTCPCGKKLAARAEHVGKRAKCPACGKMLLIALAGSPEPSTAPSVAAAPAASMAGADTVMPSGNKTLLSAPPAAESFDGQTLEYWLDLLASSDPAERRKAADVLAAVGPEAAGELRVLVAHTRSPHVLVRHWATACIGQIGTAAKDALEPLLSRLDDDQPLVREKAAKAVERVIPGSELFVARLLRELNDQDAARRNAAIEVFRRDLKTVGVSRFRFWACACGRVYIKLDLGDRLRKLLSAPDELNWEGRRACGQCGASYEDRDIYAGRYDVAKPYWPKLWSRFGKQLSVPDDFFDDSKEDAGYRLSDSGAGELTGMPSPGVFSLALDTVLSPDGDEEGYAIADASPTPLYGVLGPRNAEKKTAELVPGAAVPESGKYKCTSCTKRRLSSPAGGPTTKPVVRANVVMPFKAGKTFGECPKCGELTEWEFLG
ncbi:MAG TPA: HEAT repeat domain-containing protein [Pirellulales bacterium]|nr:HEAT repeat domain-containing protein [Pirellulales bacterium]